MHFHNEGLDCEKNYLQMFFCDWPILYPWKISAFTVQPFMYFVKKWHIFYHICGENIFPAKCLRFYTSQKKLSDLGQNWAKTKQLLLKIFQLLIAMEGCIVQCDLKVCNISSKIKLLIDLKKIWKGADISAVDICFLLFPINNVVAYIAKWATNDLL